MTRHRDDRIRQFYLSSIIRLRERGIPAFVLQLAGAYVIEILQVIEESLAFLDHGVYTDFLPNFLELTQQRFQSYYYYRRIKRGDYVGFGIAAFFERLLQNAPQ